MREFSDMSGPVEKPKPKALRIVLIILGVLAACCLVCWGSSFVIGKIGAPQAELLTTLMIGTLAQSGDDNPLANLGTEMYLSFETPQPSQTRKPSLTPTIFEPTLTATHSLPDVASCVPQAERVRGLVVKVLSGDMIQVVVREQTWTVKYIGIRSPSIGLQSEPFGIEASVANRSMVENQVVTLVSDAAEMDSGNEFHLRYVFVNDQFINTEMLQLGLAKADPLPPNTSCAPQFMLAEKFAMEQRLGMWVELVPTPLTGEETNAASQTPAGPVCDCKGPDLQCDDFPTRADAQACFDLCKTQGFGDKFLMDMNRNGIACEGKTP